MPDDIFGRMMERVNAFDGMKIDAAVWNKAHELHRQQQCLHHMGFHGGGIAYGLEVHAETPPDRSVHITSGLAVDAAGTVIVVPETQRFTFTSKRKGELYLVIQFREVPSSGSSSTDDETTRQSLLQQAFRIQEAETPAGDMDVELARVDIGDPKAPIADPGDQFHPGANELDLRFRQYAGTHVRGDIKIGQLILKDQDQPAHTEGLLHLLDHINNESAYRARFLGLLSAEDDLEQCSILYFAGEKAFTLTPEEEQTLTGFLKTGGFILGDGCRAGQKDQFGLAFDQMATALKRKPSQMKRGHPALRSLYLFAEPPEGARDNALVMVADGLAYCGGDFGCAWNGGGEGKSLARESIRVALEFGANMAVFGFRQWSRSRLKKS